MTVVAGINAGQFAIIAADSRVTTSWPERLRTHVDCCQKVFRIGDATIVGFCGDLVAIAEILTTFSLLYQANPQCVTIERFKACMGPGLREGSKDFYERTGRPFDVGVMAAGRTDKGEFDILLCQSPNFDVMKVGINQFAAMGSGTPIFEPIAKDIERHLPKTVDFSLEAAPHVLAFDLGVWLERKMPESSIDTVGRILHILCVQGHDVTRVPYEIQNLVTLEEDHLAKEVVVGTRSGESGEWIQYTGDGAQIILRNPMELLADKDFLRNDKTLSVYGLT